MTVVVRYYLQNSASPLERLLADAVAYEDAVEATLEELQLSKVVLIKVGHPAAGEKHSRLIPPHAIRYVDVLQQPDDDL